MRPFRCPAVLFLSFLVVLVPVVGHQSAPPTSAPTLLQQSLAALNGNTSVSDVTLAGTARRIDGSDDETGTITLKGLSSGGTRLEFSFPTGTLTEYKTIVSIVLVGSWSGPDGVSHPIAYHNLINDWGWFPAFTIAASSNTQNSVVALVGSETRNGASVFHIAVTQQFPALSGDDAALMQHLSQMDKKFRAFDKATGKQLWETTLPFAGNATPATYEVNGRQFVVIAAGGGKDPKSGSGGVYVAFSLPQVT